MILDNAEDAQQYAGIKNYLEYHQIATELCNARYASPTNDRGIEQQADVYSN